MKQRLEIRQKQLMHFAGNQIDYTNQRLLMLQFISKLQNSLFFSQEQDYHRQRRIVRQQEKELVIDLWSQSLKLLFIENYYIFFIIVRINIFVVLRKFHKSFLSFIIFLK